MATTSLPYHEPGIVTILTQASFLLLLNVANFFLDRSLYCGLLGQIFLGMAYGTPGGKWLGTETEGVIVQLGYLGLLLLVYEGGLSTSLRALKANLALSSCVAITGISLPMGLSFTLSKLTGATPIQCFAAGAALCSTSLGTTFTVLGSSGLKTSRLGVVLTSAAMMDDVVGLVMVQIISNLGASTTSVSAVTVIRPLLVSVAFAVCAPLACAFIVKPLTLWLNVQRRKRPSGWANRLLTKIETAWVIHTAILLGCIAASTFAGTSNLFAAYIAGACISWWDAEIPHHSPDAAMTTNISGPTENTSTDTPSSDANNERTSTHTNQGATEPASSGLVTFEKYYIQALDRILRPFFFASIGFSIPITEMFGSSIVWKGVVYTILMIIGKVFCGIWLIRIEVPNPSSLPTKIKQLSKLPGLGWAHFWGRAHTKASSPSNMSNRRSDQPSESPTTTTASQPVQEVGTQAATPHDSPSGVKPRSIYPASILGCAMTARGEIGFLISSIAEGKNVFSGSQEGPKPGQSSENFLVVTWAIMLCTILGPLAVGLIVNRVKHLQRGVERQGRVVQGDILGVWGVS